MRARKRGLRASRVTRSTGRLSQSSRWQPCALNEGYGAFELDQEIDVACGRQFAARCRAEQPQAGDSMLLEFRAARGEQREDIDWVGHGRTSPIVPPSRTALGDGHCCRSLVCFSMTWATACQRRNECDLERRGPNVVSDCLGRRQLVTVPMSVHRTVMAQNRADFIVGWRGDRDRRRRGSREREREPPYADRERLGRLGVRIVNEGHRHGPVHAQTTESGIITALS